MLIKDIKDKKLRDLALSRCDEGFNEYHLLAAAFTWSTTPEGENFWFGVDNETIHSVKGEVNYTGLKTKSHLVEQNEMLKGEVAKLESIKDHVVSTLCLMGDNLAVAKKRNEVLINSLKQVKQQLIDGGRKEDSITIASIDAAIEENTFILPKKY